MTNYEFVDFESFDFRAANYQSTNRNYAQCESANCNCPDGNRSHRLRSHRQCAHAHRSQLPGCLAKFVRVHPSYIPRPALSGMSHSLPVNRPFKLMEENFIDLSAHRK
jgi:hypothetical protein